MALKAKKIFKLHSQVTRNQMSSIPKGHFTVYVGETERKRFILPVSYLNHPSFQELLSSAEEARVWVHSSNGWSYNSVQGIHFRRSDLSFDNSLEEEGVCTRRKAQSTQGFFSPVYHFFGSSRLELLTISFSLFNFWKRVVVD